MKHTKSVFLTIVAAAALLTAAVPGTSRAHCQIPCGIYDDHARVVLMIEDAATIEKAVTLITELSGKTDPQSQNQLVRWVMNKEQHAQNIISAISDYFLTQRVQPAQEDYAERLAKHHAVIIAAMEAKQNADMGHVNALKSCIKALLAYYPASGK